MNLIFIYFTIRNSVLLLLLFACAFGKEFYDENSNKQNVNIGHQRKGRSIRSVSGSPEISYSSRNFWVSSNTTTITTLRIGDRISATSNSTIIIKCPFTGDPYPRVTWFFNGRVIDHVKFRNIDISEPKSISTLKLYKLDDYHVGNYKCMVFNKHGRDTRSTSVRKIDPFQPTIFSERYVKAFSVLQNIANINIGTNITVYDDTHVSIKCVVKAKTENYLIKWTFTSNSNKLYSLKRNETILTLGLVNISNSGVYSCIINDGVHTGDQQSSKIIVTRKVLPSIQVRLGIVRYIRGSSTAVLQIGKTAFIKAGFDVKIACPFVAVPKGKSTWQRNGMTLALPSDNVNVVEYRNQLVIKNIQESHSDVYTCVVRNKIGMTSASTKINVLPIDSLGPKIIAGRRSRTIKIIATDKITPVRIGESVRIIEGAPLKLVCRTTGIPEPKIIWELNRKPIVDETFIRSGNMLLILNFQQWFVGDYKCRARNAIGEARAWSDVRMIVPTPPSIKSGTSSLKIAGPSSLVEVTIGEQLKTSGGRDIQIRCESKGYPIAKLLWKRGEKMIKESDRIKIGHDRLTLVQTDEWDSGIYSCFATNGAGVATSSSNIKILPRGSPIITSVGKVKTSLEHAEVVDIEIGTNLTTSTGNALRILCPAEGSDETSYEWTINDKQLNYDTRINVNNGYELIIHDLQFFDDGIYACRVYSQFGYDKMISQIKIVPGSSEEETSRKDDTDRMVDGNPAVSNDGIISTTSGKDIVLISGASLKIRCPTRGSVRPQLSWLKDNAPIIPGIQLLPRGEILLLNSVDVSANGKYTCVMKTDIGTSTLTTNVKVIVFQHVFIKSVSGRIKATDPSSQVEVNVGMTILALQGVTIKIKCPHVAVPKAKISWLVNGKSIDENSRYTQDKVSNDIVIPKMDTEYVGVYTCRAVQRDVTSEASSKVEMLSMQKPVIKKSNKMLITKPDVYSTTFMNIGDKLTCNLDKQIQIDCQSDAIPKPQILWKFNGKDISILKGVTDMNNGSIKIDSVAWSHNGVYQCFWINNVGIDSAKSQLTVVGSYIPLDFQLDKKEFKLLNKTNSATSLTIGNNITTLASNSLLLKCPVSIYGVIRVSWLKNGEILKGTRHHRDGSVLMSNLKAKDSGEYVCYSDDKTIMKFGSIFVTVLTPTKDLLEEKDEGDHEFLIKESDIFKINIGGKVTILQGNKLELRCPVKTLTTKVGWLLNDEFFASGNGVVINKNLLSLDGSFNAGTYNITCRVEGILGKVDVSSEVVVAEPTRIHVGKVKQETMSTNSQSNFSMGTNILVLDGSSVDIECPVSGVPPPKVTWSINKKRISKFTGVYLKRNGFVLSIPFVSTRFVGDYQCVASNGADDVVTLTSKLEIYVPKKPVIIFAKQGTTKAGILGRRIRTINGNITKISSEGSTGNEAMVVEEIGKDYKILSGQTLKLICSTEGQPKPSIQWKKDGINLLNDVQYVYVDTTDTKNSGSYSCTANNPFGSITESSLVDIIVPSKPLIQRDPDRSNVTEILSHMDGSTKVEVFIGDDLKTIVGTIICIRCPAIGIPRPTITYFKDGTILNNTNNTYTDNLGSLFISPASKAKHSEGVYTCHAENEAGFQRMNTSILLYEPVKPQFSPPLEPPKFSYNNETKKGTLDLCVGQSVKAYPNTLAVIKCPVAGFPFPVVIWEKDGEVLADGVVSVLKDNSTTLIYEIINGGVFTCTATNMAGSEKKMAIVTVVEPLPAKILSTNFKVITANGLASNVTIGENINIPIGSSLTLTCPTIGEPKPTVQWSLLHSKDNWLELHSHVRFAPNGFEIILTNITKDLAGEYKCTASNEYGIDKQVSYIKINDIAAPRIAFSNTIFAAKNIGYKEVTAIVGGSLYVRRNTRVVIDCPVTGAPTPEVKWTKNGKALLKSIDYDPFSHILTIENINIQHEGIYTCMASNFINTDTASTNIHVGFSPSIKTVPRNLSPLISVKSTELKIPIGVKEAFVPIGGEAVFHCVSYGYPLPKITWYFNGNPIDYDNTDKYESLIPSVLAVKKLLATNGGEYSCTAHNMYGKLLRKTTLKIMEPPTIVSTNENTTITEYSSERVNIAIGGTLIIPIGMSIIIKCPANGSPQPNIIWSKENSSFIVEPRVYITINNHFHMNHLTLSDSGIYVCSASNTVGTVSSMTHLLVAEKPKAAMFPNFRSSKAGKTIAVSNGKGKLITTLDAHIRLYCHVKGSPTPKVTWLKDHDIVRTSDRHKLTNYELEVTHVTKKDEGTYVCMAENVLGATTAVMHLTIGASPTINRENIKARKKDNIIEVGIGSSVDVNVGTTLKIRCGSSGFPQPRISWKKNDIITHVPVRIQSGENDVLTLRGVTTEAAGNYTCNAKNLMGVDAATTTVSVLDPAKIIILKKEKKIKNYVVGIDKEIHVIEGVSLRISCYSSGHPSPNISLLRSSDPLSTNMLQHIVSTDQLNDVSAYLKTKEHDLSTTIQNKRRYLVQRRIIKHNGRPIRVTIGEIYFASAKLKHIGIYTCETHNLAGKDTADVSLFVYPKPNKPYKGVWRFTDYTTCATPCVRSNYGSQSRKVTCISNDRTILNNRMCEPGIKPKSTKECFTTECSTEWRTGTWSRCSRPCGKDGTQKRNKFCIYTNTNKKINFENCPIKSTPSSRRSCNLFPCNLDKCVDKYQYCTLIKQSGFCRMETYKTLCCFSCVKQL